MTNRPPAIALLMPEKPPSDPTELCAINLQEANSL
jgi:hypothetical protein